MGSVPIATSPNQLGAINCDLLITHRSVTAKLPSLFGDNVAAMPAWNSSFATSVALPRFSLARATRITSDRKGAGSPPRKRCDVNSDENQEWDTKLGAGRCETRQKYFTVHLLRQCPNPIPIRGHYSTLSTRHAGRAKKAAAAAVYDISQVFPSATMPMQKEQHRGAQTKEATEKTRPSTQNRRLVFGPPPPPSP